MSLFYGKFYIYFKTFNLNPFKGCFILKVIWLFYCTKLYNHLQMGKVKIAQTSFFSISIFPFAPSCSPLPPYMLKVITEIQFLIPPYRSAIDCKQIYIQAVNRKLQICIYWVCLERNKLAREPCITSELTRRWITERCKCMEGRDILHSVIQHIAACL